MERNKDAIQSNQSTEKALLILEYLAEAGAPVRMIDIAHDLGIHTSTVNRYLSALVNSKFVEQDPETLRYQPSYKICRLANNVLSHRDDRIRDITHPYLQRLSEIFDESTCVSLERDMQMVYIDVVTGRGKMIMTRQRVGNTAPMHSTGNGKLCLSEYDEAHIDRLIAERGLPRFTEYTLTNKEALMAKLAMIRENGYACDEEECEIGMRCLAYPLRNYTGKIIGGLSVTGPAARLTLDVLLSKQKYLQEAAEEISERLGYKKP